jgi:CheY-like chemotaxis protein
MENRPINILLADDDPDDAELIRAALVRSKMPHLLQHVSDGEQALSFLKSQSADIDGRPFSIPDVLLLDLKMPRMNGFEVLQSVRAIPQWKDLPIFVLTSSDEPSDIARAYELGATLYLTKTSAFKNVIEALSDLSAA